MKESLDDKFNFFIPVEFEKAKTAKGEEIMRVRGVASTDDKDSEEEVLLPVGFQLDRFINYGQINWNHQGKNDPGKIIGEPDIARITPDGKLYIEGTLYKGHPLAESVWQYAKTLEANGSKRKLGWSIEGRATERDPMNPKRITKALITGVAITPTPVNVNTYVDLCKGEQKNDYINYEYDKESILEKAEKESKYLFEFENSGKKYGITKSFTVEEIEKCMDVAATKPLVPESLDKKPKVLEPAIRKAVLNGFIPLKLILSRLK